MSKVIFHKVTEQKLKDWKVDSWPIWTKEISRFDWYYDQDETCYILEGRVIVETDEGNYEVKKGDLVTFKEGLKCVWDVKEPIKKHYNFGKIG